MRFFMDAACCCNIGNIRNKNQDNFYFDKKCLEPENRGLHNPVLFSDYVENGLCFAIFDGMGGEKYGEIAAYTAAKEMLSVSRAVSDYFIPVKKYLLRLTSQLNNAVVAAQKELHTDKCGTTMAALYFSSGYVYTCNVGDSRTYRLRNGEFLQMSVDHVEKLPLVDHKKPPLTQYLGLDPEDVEIEPYIAKGKMEAGDRYLLCSDGLTDMLSNVEISGIMNQRKSPGDTVAALLDAALERGGRDNITIIMCEVQ